MTVRLLLGMTMTRWCWLHQSRARRSRAPKAPMAAPSSCTARSISDIVERVSQETWTMSINYSYGQLNLNWISGIVVLPRTESKTRISAKAILIKVLFEKLKA